MKFEERYSKLDEGPQPMEIVLLQGRGCFWKKCTFCDYYDDAGPDETSIPLNSRVLAQVTGAHRRLVALNSGTYFELPKETRAQITALCQKRGIRHLHVESHWRMADKMAALREDLAHKGIALHGRIGIETFDEDFREGVMVKGMGRGLTPQAIARIFDECCLLFGMEGQTKAGFLTDLALAKEHFKDVYINLFNDNTTAVHGNPALITWFVETQAPQLKKDPQCHVLIHNTDLGVGD